MAKAILTKRTTSGYVASDGDGNRVRIDYPHHINGTEARHAQAAIALCKKMGWTGILECNWLRNNEWVFTFATEANMTFSIGA